MWKTGYILSQIDFLGSSLPVTCAEGMEKGMEKKSHEIAKKMLTKGMDEATVMEITGLSAELIQQLKAEM